MEDYDTGEQDFDGNKVCLENVSNGNYSWVEFHFSNTFFLSHGGFYRHFGRDIFSVFVCSLCLTTEFNLVIAFLKVKIDAPIWMKSLLPNSPSELLFTW